MLPLATMQAFVDEASKIASKKTQKTPAAPQQTLAAREANQLFMRPEVPKVDPRKLIDTQGNAAQSVTRGDASVDGQSSANVGTSNTVSPSTGPGGV